MFKRIVLAFMFMVLTGCAVMEQIESSPMTSQLVTDQLTLRFIAGSDDPVARAARVRSVVDQVRSDLSGAESYSIATIDQVVRDKVDWQALSVADQALLDFALSKARASLADLIGEGAIDPQDTQTIDTLLTWIDNAAMRVQ